MDLWFRFQWGLVSRGYCRVAVPLGSSSRFGCNNVACRLLLLVSKTFKGFSGEACITQEDLTRKQ